MGYISNLRKIIGHELIQVPGCRVILINKNQEILLQKRSDFKIWGLPAGSPEIRDSISDCIKREVKEETGLDLLSFSIFGFASNPASEIITYPNGDKIHNYSLMVYSNHYSGQQIKENDETLELKWYSVDSLPEMIQNHINTVNSYMKFRKTNQFQLI